MKVRVVKIWSFYMVLAGLSLSLVSLIYYKLLCHFSSLDGLKQYRQVMLERGKEVDGNVFMPVLMPVCGRLKYLKTVLESLSKVSDIERTILIVSDDCRRPEVVKYFKEKKFPFPVIQLYHEKPYFSLPTLYYRNNEYATAHNVYFLLKFAFDYLKAPASIVLESDLEPGKDFYRYFQWTYRLFMDPKTEMDTLWKGRTLCVNGYGDHSVNGDSNLDPFTFYPYIFVVWGWMTSKERWISNLRHNWTPMGGWDYWIQDQVRAANDLVCMSPHLSRIKNIGAEGENYHISEEDYAVSEFGRIIIDSTTDRSFDNAMAIVSDKTYHI